MSQVWRPNAPQQTRTSAAEQRSRRQKDDPCFISIATNRLKEEKLEAEGSRAADLCAFIEANEPQLLAFNEYVNDDGSEVAVVQVHPDAASIELHTSIRPSRC